LSRDATLRSGIDLAEKPRKCIEKSRDLISVILSPLSNIGVPGSRYPVYVFDMFEKPEFKNSLTGISSETLFLLFKGLSESSKYV